MALSARIPESKWEELKDDVYQIYVVENQTLKELRTALRTRLSFEATQVHGNQFLRLLTHCRVPQYTRMLEKWGFKKNHPAKTWIAVKNSLEKQNLACDKVNILIQGQQISAKRASRALSRYSQLSWRHRPTSMARYPCSPHTDYFCEAHRCSTPEHIQICPRHSRFDSLRIIVRLPWQEFDRQIAWTDWVPKALKSSTLAPQDLESVPEISRSMSNLYNYPGHGGPGRFKTQEISMCLDLDSSRDLPAPVCLNSLSYHSLQRLPDLLLRLEVWTRPFLLQPADESSPIAALRHITSENDELAVRAFTSYMAFLVSNNLLNIASPQPGDDRTWSAMSPLAMLQNKSLGARIFNQLEVVNTPTKTALFAQLAHSAVRSMANDVVINFLKRGLSVESPTPGFNPQTLLWTAISGKNIEMLEVLINAGADPNASPYKDRILHGECIECQGQWSDDPLTTALRSGLPDQAISLLLKSGTQVPHCHIIYTAIQYSASANTVSALLKAGARPDHHYLEETGRIYGDLWGTNKEVNLYVVKPSSKTTRQSYRRIFEQLLKTDIHPEDPIYGCQNQNVFRYDLDKLFRSPLFLATETRNYEIVKLLLSGGANPDLSSFDTMARNGDCCKESPTFSRAWYTDRLPKPNRCFCIYPIQAAAAFEDLKLAKLLRYYGASIEVNWGTPPLAVAAFNARLDTVTWLLEQGADVNAFGDGIYGLSPVEAAVYARSIPILEILMDAGADIDRAPLRKGGRTALQAAAEIGDSEIVQYLIDKGADIHKKCAPEWGITVLEGYIENGDHANVVRALGLGVSSSRSVGSYSSPLCRAIAKKDTNVIRLLLEAGVDVNEKASATLPVPWLYGFLRSTDVISPLHQAVMVQDFDIFCHLYSKGGDLSQPSTENCISILHLAVCFGNSAIVEFALQNGAEVNSMWHGSTPLAAAISRREISLVTLLIEHGANFNTKLDLNLACYRLLDKDRYSKYRDWPLLDQACYGLPYALDVACYWTHIPSILFLLQSGADARAGCPVVSLLSRSLVSTPLESLLNILDLLKSYGADVNAEPEWAATPLCLVLDVGAQHSLHLVKKLVELGANVNNMLKIQHMLGYTALTYAISQDYVNVDIVEYLLSKGANVNSCGPRSSSGTALTWAASGGYLRIAQLLLMHGALMELYPSNASTRAIDEAAELGRLDMVKFLLDNYNGYRKIAEVCRDALKAAEVYNQWHVAQLLKDYSPPARIDVKERHFSQMAGLEKIEASEHRLEEGPDAKAICRPIEGQNFDASASSATLRTPTSGDAGLHLPPTTQPLPLHEQGFVQDVDVFFTDPLIIDGEILTDENILMAL